MVEKEQAMDFALKQLHEVIKPLKKKTAESLAQLAVNLLQRFKYTEREKIYECQRNFAAN